MVYSFAMTITRADFLRVLQDATEHTAVTAPDGTLVAGAQGPPWRLKLSPLEPFLLGPVALERHWVELDLTGCTPAEEAAFLERFGRYFQRGGG
jgi:hypothetical protein